MRNVLDIGSWFGRGEAEPPGTDAPAVNAADEVGPPASPAPPPGPACPLEGTHERLASLSEGLARVEEAILNRSSEAERAERLIDRLDAEVKRLRQREEERRMESAIQRVIGLFDQVSTVAEGIRARQEEMA